MHAQVKKTRDATAIKLEIESDYPYWNNRDLIQESWNPFAKMKPLINTEQHNPERELGWPELRVRMWSWIKDWSNGGAWNHIKRKLTDQSVNAGGQGEK